MSKTVKHFKKELYKELDKHILPYWIERMVDKEQGGFYGRVDGNNTVDKKAGKGSVLNARILWTFSAAFNFSHEPKYLKMANRAFDYCIKNFINRDRGGMYWLLDHTGRPVEKKNQIYALAFMIYGLSEYYRATGITQAIEDAVDLFHKIEKYSFDPENNGYYEAFDEHWNILDDMRLSDKDANEKKSMNTHLHILEAYTNLYRDWDDGELRDRIKNLVNVFADRIIDPKSRAVKLFFDEKWISKSKVRSFGHDIEGSWLIYEAADAIKDQNLIRKTGELAVNMVDSVMVTGFDKDGGLFNESDDSKIIDTDKHWWPQAEAMVGLVNAWQLTGQDKYLDQAFSVWNFIKNYIIDRKNGEWFYRVSRDGKPYPDEDKAGFWKCPYHNSRACLEIIRRLKE